MTNHFKSLQVSTAAISAEQQQLAAAMGLDPDDVLVQAHLPVIRAVTENTQAVNQCHQTLNYHNETILELLKLLTQKSQETERLGLAVANLSRTYEPLPQQFAVLQQQIAKLSTQLQSVTIAQQDWRSMADQQHSQACSERQELRQGLQYLIRQLRRVGALVDPRKWNASALGVAVAIIFVILGVNFLGLQQANYRERLDEATLFRLQQVEQLHNSALIRLERIERALGTVP